MAEHLDRWFSAYTYLIFPKFVSNKAISESFNCKIPPLAIAAVGDSITFGAGVVATRETDSYPALLEKALGKEYRVVNYGLSGRTLLSNTAKPYFKEALAKKYFKTIPIWLSLC